MTARDSARPEAVYRSGGNAIHGPRGVICGQGRRGGAWLKAHNIEHNHAKTGLQVNVRVRVCRRLSISINFSVFLHPTLPKMGVQPQGVEGWLGRIEAYNCCWR